MWTISKQFTFSAAHQLAGLGDDHKCARMHGHNYRVTVALAGSKLDGQGMLIDYGDISQGIGTWFKLLLDHRCLGCNGQCDAAARLGHLDRMAYEYELLPVADGLPATAENLAWLVWHVATTEHGLPVAYIEVAETDGTTARYYGPDPADGGNVDQLAIYGLIISRAELLADVHQHPLPHEGAHDHAGPRYTGPPVPPCEHPDSVAPHCGVCAP